MSEQFTLIGIGDSRSPELSREAREVLLSHRVFAGGVRHRAIVASLLPSGYRWITISPPLDGVLASLGAEPEPVAVFTSGDPFFYGFGATLQRVFPDAALRCFPFFHSLQLLAHRMLLPYQQMRHASLTGRGWQELDRLLIAGSPLIGVLTDSRKTPAAIASRLLDFGFTEYVMVVGEALGGPEERVRTFRPEDAADEDFHSLNCVLLMAEEPPWRSFGIGEAEFEGLPGRPDMITKMPVRMATLSRLNLVNAGTFWDIGFCTGSVSIEAKRLTPDLEVTAFERRPECEAIFRSNCRRFRVPGIRTVMGDFLDQRHEIYAGGDGTLDAVFIGGHGGRLREVFAVLDRMLSPGGRVAVNAVQQSTLDVFRSLTAGSGYRQLEELRIVSGSHHPITIAAAEKNGTPS